MKFVVRRLREQQGLSHDVAAAELKLMEEKRKEQEESSSSSYYSMSSEEKGAKGDGIKLVPKAEVKPSASGPKDPPSSGMMTKVKRKKN